MNKDPKISHIQLRGLIVSNVIGVGVLALPNTLAEPVGNNGWLIIMITGVIFIGLFVLYDKIFKLYPGKAIFEIAKETLGFFSYPSLIIMCIYFTLTGAIVARNLGELMKVFLLQNTPIGVIILVFIMASTYLASYEIDSIARLGYFLYPIIILFTVSIIAISLPKADFTNMLPVFETDMKSIIKGIGVALFSFYGIEISLFALPFVEQRDKALKSGILAIVTIVLIYISLNIMTVSHFSIEQIKSIVYPVLMLVRQLDLPGFFLENLDGLVIALWSLVVFATMVPTYFVAAKILSKVFNIKKHKYFVLGLVPVIFIISMLPENFIELFDVLGRYHNIFAFISLLVIPVSILISASVRKKVSK